jgi:hypothetical protein
MYIYRHTDISAINTDWPPPHPGAGVGVQIAQATLNRSN